MVGILIYYKPKSKPNENNIYTDAQYQNGNTNDNRNKRLTWKTVYNIDKIVTSSM